MSGRGARGATIDSVTTTVTGAPPGPTAARPPLVRPRSGRVLAGVAAGTAAHLRQDPLIVRVAFVVLATAGIGIVAYVLLWLTMPVAEPGVGGGRADRPASAGAPGAGAQVVGLGRARPSPRPSCSASWSSGAPATSSCRWCWSRSAWPSSGGSWTPTGTLAVPGVRWALAGGVALAAGGVVLLLATTGQLAAARNGFAATLVILTGVVLATAPVWRRLLDSRAEERTARIRSEERAAVAAHLHDSVLQTLALIQRHADEPQAVGRLARSQERELRAWLYDPEVVREGGTWAGLVAGMVAEVEADHALIVDPVVVGDAPVDDALAGLGAATREALVNAAKHSGATAADLYTEVDRRARVGLRARPRRRGSTRPRVPADRRGLRTPSRPAGPRWAGRRRSGRRRGRGPRWSSCCPGAAA